MTLALGLASVFMFNGSLKKLDKKPVNLPQIKSESPLIVIPKEEIVILNDVEIVVSRGCGLNESSGITWHMSNGNLSEGVSCGKDNKETKKDFQKLLAKSKIIERAKNIKNLRGEKGERMILEVFEKNEKYAEIIWFDGGKCYYYIKAPTLELALDFEKSDLYNKQYWH